MKNLWKVLTLSCDEATHILSDQQDRELTRIERAALKAHLVSCVRCKRFRRQLEVIKQAAKRTPEMPPKVFERIRAALADQAKGPED
jgi:hypothetical protein